MERISSRELTEWMAYEIEEGPLGPRWQDETMAAIHEQLQRLNHIQGAAHFTDRKHKKNPVPSPKHYTRPYEIFEKSGDDRDRYDPDEDQLDTESMDTFGGEPEGTDHGDADTDGVPD
jgi:hypothetical protein